MRIIIMSLALFAILASATVNSLFEQMEHELVNFKSLESQQRNPAAETKQNYAQKNEALSFLVEHLAEEAQNSYVGSEEFSVSQKDKKNIQSMLANNFNYFIQVYNSVSKVESENNLELEEYKSKLLDLLVASAIANETQLAAYNSLAKQSGDEIAIEVQNDVNFALCAQHGKCDSNQGADIVLSEAYNLNVDASLEELASLPADPSLANELFSQERDPSRSVSGEKNNEVKH